MMVGNRFLCWVETSRGYTGIRYRHDKTDDTKGSGLWSGEPVATGHSQRVHFLCVVTVNKTEYFLLECR